MNRLIVARHGESEYNVAGLINADPASRSSPLTEIGRRQAGTLRDRVAAEPIDLCVTSQTQRALQTAETLVSGRGIPLMTLASLNDPAAGVFEGGPVDTFATWIGENPPDTPIPGTATSLVSAAERFHEAATFLLNRTEEVIFVIAHAPVLRWILQAATGRYEALDYHAPIFGVAEPLEIDVPGLRGGVDQLRGEPFTAFSSDPAD